MLPIMLIYSVLLCLLIVLSSTQQHKPSRNAAILSEARYLAINGQFGSAYKQEDGVEFKEESDDQGNRRGSYSYIDPNGIRRAVLYTAGRDGFRAIGNHLPVPPTLPTIPLSQPVPIATSSLSSDGQYNPMDDYYDSDSQPKTYQSHYNYDYSSPNNGPSFVSPSNHYNSIPQTQFNPTQFQFQSPQFTSEVPHVTHRLSPQGKLTVNHSPDGYSYTFNQV